MRRILSWAGRRWTESARGRAVALAALPVLLAPAWQQRDDREALVLTALPAVHRTLPEGTVALDPRLLCVARLAGWSCPDPVRRTVESLGLVVNGRDLTLVCLGGPEECRLVGADVLVEFSRPEIERRRGSVMVDVWWATSEGDPPVAHRRSRVLLERSGRGWRVREIRPVGPR